MPVRFPKEMSPKEIGHITNTIDRPETHELCLTIIKYYSTYMEKTRDLREKLSNDIDKLVEGWPDPPSTPDE